MLNYLDKIALLKNCEFTLNKKVFKNKSKSNNKNKLNGSTISD